MHSAQITSPSLGVLNDLLASLVLFRRAVASGRRRRFWRWLRGRSSMLCTRSVVWRSPGTLGRRTVAIAAIVGSEGRANDFDNAFAPLNQRTRDRWLRVAAARRRGATLPPVVLLATNEGYYVRDGHHRISVASALGEEFIEAEVVG